MTPTLIHVVCLSGPDAGMQFVATSIADAIRLLQAMEHEPDPPDVLGVTRAEELEQWFGQS